MTRRSACHIFEVIFIKRPSAGLGKFSDNSINLIYQLL